MPTDGDRLRLVALVGRPTDAGARGQVLVAISSAPGTAVANSFKTFECLLVLLCSPVQAPQPPTRRFASLAVVGFGVVGATSVLECLGVQIADLATRRREEGWKE